MKAAIIKQHGPPESIAIEERARPEPKEGQVLVRVAFCGLNHLDTWVRRGVEGHRFPLPMIPGSDVSGTIEKLATNTASFNLKIGDRVIVDPGICCHSCSYCTTDREHLCQKWGLLGETTDGGHCQFIAVDARQVLKLPDTISLEQAACIPVAYVTAWQMLMKKAQLTHGQTILIHSAGSGVSVACLEIAKACGAEIFITSSLKEKLTKAKALGAHHVIHSEEPLVDYIRKHTGKTGVDVVVDHVAGTKFMDSIRCLKRGGKLVSCGATAGSIVQIDWKVVFFKNIALLGSTYGTHSDFLEVMEALKNKKIAAIIDRIMNLEELPKAHRLLEERNVFGKLLIEWNAKI